MDILDILLDILLKPPQPFIGLFFIHNSVFMKLTLTGAKIFLQSDMKIACKEKK